VVAGSSVRANEQAPVLELRGITKQFPGVVANDHVDFDLRREEMRAPLAGTMDVEAGLTSLRATTTDHLGFTGRQEALVAQAVALLTR
jgi:2C-methyl-D-erythritol 2,4-cyclodiphosphate synthase